MDTATDPCPVWATGCVDTDTACTGICLAGLAATLACVSPLTLTTPGCFIIVLREAGVTLTGVARRFVAPVLDVIDPVAEETWRDK